MEFDQKQYIKEYAKNTYKDIKFRVRKDDIEFLNYLDSKDNISSYIRNLVINDMNSDSNKGEVLTKKQLNKLLYKITIAIQKDDEIKEMWLFGSYAYGKPNKGSDIDLAFVVNTKKTNSMKSGEISYNLSEVFKYYYLNKDILCFKTNEKTEAKKRKNSITNVGSDVFNKGIKIYERNQSRYK